MASFRPIFGGTYEELVAAKVAWDRQHPSDENAFDDPIARARRATRNDMAKNKEKYQNIPVYGPGPMTKLAIASRIATEQRDNENLTLDEVGAILAKEFNTVVIDPGSASMKVKQEEKNDSMEVEFDMADLTLPEDFDLDEEEEDDWIDEETNEHCLNVIKVGRRENKPTYVGKASVPSRKISLKSATSLPTAPSTSVDNPFDMTLDEYVQQTKTVPQGDLRDRTAMNMSLDDIIRAANSAKAQKAAETVAARRKNRKHHPTRFKKYVSFSREQKLGTIDEVPETPAAAAAERMKISRIYQKHHGQGGGTSSRKFNMPANMEIGKWASKQDYIDTTVKTRDDFLRRDRQRTPESVLHEMTQNGFDVEYQALEMQEKLAPSEEEFRAKRWRVVYTVQDVNGVGVAPRKELAKQLAAFDVLRQIKERVPDLQLQFCQIPLADRINPIITHNLARECHERRIRLRYNCDTVLEDNVISHARFIAVYTCGEQPYYGFSVRGPDDAKKMAAKAAYEGVTGEKVPFDPLLLGEACGDGSKYQYIWSEAHHVYETSDPKNVKYFTKTNLFGADPSVVQTAVGEAAKKPHDPEVLKQAEAVYLEELEMVEELEKIREQMGKKPNEFEESFYLDHPSGVGAETHIVESIEKRACKLGEQMAEQKKRAPIEEAEIEMEAEGVELEEEIEELDPRLRARNRRKWK